MRKILYITAFLFTLSVAGTLPIKVSLEELVYSADHILTGNIIKIDMVSKYGTKIVDDSAKTGPGIGNVIRFHIKVKKFHFTNSMTLPETIIVPLDPMMHYSLGTIKKHEPINGDDFLLLLKGPNFNALFPGVFARGLEEKEIIFKLKREQLKRRYGDDAL